MTAYPSRQRNPSRKEVEEVLQDVDFPLAKQALVAQIEHQHSEPAAAVLHQLSSLPLGTYDSLDEVLQSIDTADQRGP